MIKTYDQAVEYLKSFIPFTLYQTEAYKKKELKDPLDRMRYLLKLLDNPEKKFKSVLIGGTSGKGSTSYLISHMLTTAGYKTGLTLSPHLVRINERIKINNEEISDEDFVNLINLLTPAIEKMKNTEYGLPSYFEITIAMAFIYFAMQKIDIAVVEVGMGGTYDATNVLESLVAVLTNVSLDHTQFLGETVEEISRTKVGIIKKYLSPHPFPLAPIVITGVQQASVIKIVEDKCKQVGANLFRLGKDFKPMSLRAKRGNLDGYVFGLQGDYQKENASLAIETIKQLTKFGFSVSQDKIQKSLQTAHFPGRFEEKELKIENCKLKIVLDGAHNPAKMHAFVTSLQKAYPKQKKIFVIAFKKDKNIADMLKEIIPVADIIVATEFEIGTDTMISNASIEVEDIFKTIKSLTLYSSNKVRSSHAARTILDNVYLEKDSSKAVQKAISLCHPGLDPRSQDTVIAITGSLYLIGEIKQSLTFLE